MKKSKIKIISTLIILITISGAVGYALYTQKFKANDGSAELSLYTVKRGPLTISVLESGTLKARDVEIIKSEVEGSTTVLWVIDEATKVKKGEKLIELDASGLTDSKDKQDISLQNAKTSKIIAKTALEVVKNKTTSEVAKAKLTLDLAKIDLEQYVGKNKEDGEYATQLKDSLEKIRIANMEVKRTFKKHQGSVALKKDNYISETELKSDEISMEKAKLDLSLQKSQLYILENYTYKKTLAELNGNVEQTEMAYKIAKDKKNANILEATEQLKSANAKYKIEKKIFDKIVEQIGKAVIYAPNDGMVIYASSTKISWRNNEEPLSEGQNVREREELFHLPKADLMSVVANVHEANLDKVKLGSSVTIKVDAVPGEIFTGKIGTIAIMPDARMVYINPNLKVYKTEMFIDKKDTPGYRRLRTGMGCQAEVMTAHFEDAIYVPIQTVITIGEQPTVYVHEDGEMQPRSVEIGQDNNRMIHILSGLQEGEQVLMTPPLSQAEVKNKNTNGKASRKQGGPTDKRPPKGKSPAAKQGAENR